MAIGHGALTSQAARAAAVMATAVLLLGATAPQTAVQQPVAAAVRPAVPNPPIDESCGIDVTMILDASGSIRSAGAVDSVRNAAQAFLEALADTNSTARVIDFGTNARQTAPKTNVTTGSISAAGALGHAVSLYYNPIPLFPTGVAGHAYRGGNRNVFSESSYTNGSSVEYTNWDDALNKTATGPPELVLFLTDGAPNAVVADHPGDPFYRSGDTTPDVLYGLDGNQQADDLSLDRAVEEANRLKNAGSRMLAVGVGDAFGPGSSDNVDRLKAVTNGAASNVVTSAAGIDDLNDVDVALVQDFDALAQALREIVTQLCSPSLTIQKLAQTPGSAAYTPAAGWRMTVTPTVAAAGTPPYRWILPVANAPVGPAQDVTNANGFAQFQWEPNPPSRTSTAVVTETNQSGYTPRDWACKAKNPNGSVVETSGTFTGAPTFSVTIGPEQIVTCTVRNDFNYAPAGVVTKVNSPTIVRGDGNGTNVTSTYTATNTGNTPLSPVPGTDTECAPVEYVMTGGAITGDAERQRPARPGRDLDAVVHASHPARDHRRRRADPQHGHAHGPRAQRPGRQRQRHGGGPGPDARHPRREDRHPDHRHRAARRDLHVHGHDRRQHAARERPADRRHAALLDGREPHVRGRRHREHRLPRPGRDLDLHLRREQPDGERRERGDGRGPAGHAGRPADERSRRSSRSAAPSPTTDDAEVTVETADLALVKTASPPHRVRGHADHLHLHGHEPRDGDRDAGPAGRPQRRRRRHASALPVTYQSGDTGDDSRMDPGETWIYTCTRTYAEPRLQANEATATMVVDGIGTVLTRTDPALVLIVAPAIHLEKRADIAPVYDGDSRHVHLRRDEPEHRPARGRDR